MKKISIALIKIYQATKPVRIGLTRTIIGNDRACRFYPTCSDYTEQAIKKHGVVCGSLFGAWRIVRCNPLGGKGYDPVK